MRRAFGRAVLEGFLGAPCDESGRRRRIFGRFRAFSGIFGAFGTFGSVSGPNTGRRGIREGFGLNADSRGFLGIRRCPARNPPGQLERGGGFNAHITLTHHPRSTTQRPEPLLGASTAAP